MGNPLTRDLIDRPAALIFESMTPQAQHRRDGQGISRIPGLSGSQVQSGFGEENGAGDHGGHAAAGVHK